MPRVIFQPLDKSVTVPPGTELLAAAREVGAHIEAACGGRGTCGRCIVRIVEGDVDSDSLGILPREAVAEGYVLACKTRVLDTPVTVELSGAVAHDGDGKFIEEEETHLVRQELLPKDWEFDPVAIRWLFDVPKPQLEDGRSDMDRLIHAIQSQWGKVEVIPTLETLRYLAEELRKEDGRVTATISREDHCLRVIRVEGGDHTVENYAIAVDVGTTTVAVQLIHLSLGKIIAVRSSYNDQIDCGLDVISRINYARTPERLQELRTRVLDTINRLIHRVCDSRQVSPRRIANTCVSGNTTMVHLMLGLDPEHIRLEPYTPTVFRLPYLTAQQVGLEITPDSWVYFSPSVGSYVGGDITAGLLCTDIVTESQDICLFVDIGTNGEIVVGNGEFLMSCACSAGPAFEGGGIDCGMRAAVGAIEAASVDVQTGMPTYATIGGAKPKGICGSGMIDLIANLYQTGWLDPAGKLDRTRPSNAIVIDGKRARYVIAPADQTDSGQPITISEIDIENIIRAKAAIYSACALMLDQIGIGFDDLAKIYIAGGFGRFLNLPQAIAIGLLPDADHDKFCFIGNASLMGSYMVVVSQSFRDKQIELARRMTYIDLSTHPSYMDQYTAALFLPHTDPTQFPSVATTKGRTP